MEREHIGIPIADGEQITDPAAVQGRDGARATVEQTEHDDRDHCGVGSDGRAVIDIRNREGDHLVLLHDELGVALLPNETVDPGADWAAVAREAAAGYTGIEVDLESILAVRTVDHFLPAEEEPHLTTHRIVFRGSPAGGEVDECKRAAGNGSDAWRVAWLDALPDGVSPPDGGPRNDLELVLE